MMLNPLPIEVNSLFLAGVSRSAAFNPAMMKVLILQVNWPMY
jgi:hypothetical protein